MTTNINYKTCGANEPRCLFSHSEKHQVIKCVRFPSTRLHDRYFLPRQDTAYHLRAPHMPPTALGTFSLLPPCGQGSCPDATSTPIFCNWGTNGRHVHQHRDKHTPCMPHTVHIPRGDRQFLIMGCGICRCMYTTVQKFGITQTISCLPWKITLLFIKWI